MTEPKPFTEPHEASFHRAYLECMRNMATVVPYALGASFLIHKMPVILGSRRASWPVGLLLYAAGVGGAVCAVDQFINALIARHPNLRRRRWLFLALMLPVAFLFIALPWYMTFFYGT